MEELFNVEKIEKSIGKAKRHSTWRMIFISVAVILTLGIGGAVANHVITPRLAFPIEESFMHFSQISGPNEFIGIIETYPGILGGESHYKKYKWIEGKLVFTGEGGYGYGLFRNERLGRQGRTSTMHFGGAFTQENIHYTHYNELGQRMMTFFYPQIQYKSVNDDLTYLQDIPGDKLVEMALSFDKGYSVDKAIKLIPQKLTTAFLWVNDVTEDAELHMREYVNKEPVTGSPLVRSANTVYGFSLLEPSGEAKVKPAQQFISSIQAGVTLKSRWQGEFKRLNETIAGVDGQLVVEDIVINGVVVTGTAENLQQLQKLPFIKASSLGIVADKYN